MENLMTSGAFRLKGRALLNKGIERQSADNIHQVSLRAGVSYPTIYRYVENAEQVEMINLRALYGFLVDGLGISLEEVENIPFGEVFKGIPESKRTAR